MIDTLKDIEDLEKVIKLLAPGSSNDIQNKQAILKILNNMLEPVDRVWGTFGICSGIFVDTIDIYTPTIRSLPIL